MTLLSLAVLCLLVSLWPAGSSLAHTDDLRSRILMAAKSSTEDNEELKAFAFLIETMPEDDLHSLPLSFLTNTVHWSLKARRATSWASAVPWAVFLNDVLPYAALTEPRDPWRPFFLKMFLPLALNATSLKEAAVALNKVSWDIVQPPIRFKAAPPNQINSYSPFQTMRSHYASCTGLAVFLVSAYRSVGIPARVVGVPHWDLGPARCPEGDTSPECGNHNWVEVWTEDGWAFVDQDGSPRLNTGFFYPGLTSHQSSGQVNHSVVASSWANPLNLTKLQTLYPDTVAASGHYPMVWDWDNHQVFAWDVTERYLAESFVPWP